LRLDLQQQTSRVAIAKEPHKGDDNFAHVSIWLAAQPDNVKEIRVTDGGAQPGQNPEVERLNLDIAERVKQLQAADMVELLSGRASSLLRAADNQNQNQGSRQ
jgi:hypothetical protein